MSEETLMVDRLRLTALATEFSQPFEIGSANQIEIHAWIESAATLASPYVVVQMQTSSDMDNFEDRYGFAVTLDKAPSEGKVGSSGTYDQLTGSFVRLKITGSTEDVLVSVAIRLFHT